MNTVNAIKDYLLAGTPPHGVWFLLGVYALTKDVLPKVSKVKANSPLEAIFNIANKALLPIFGKFPVLGPFLALLDTPEAPAATPPVQS